MSIPVPIIAYFFSTKTKEEIIKTTFLSSSPIVITVILIFVSFAGLAVLVYIINLRMDAILYARTINGIRKYFYDRAGIDINTKLRMRVLPQTTFFPKYHEVRYFGPVIFAFVLFNTLYLMGGIFWGISAYLFKANKISLDIFLEMLPWWSYIVVIGGVLLFIVLHFGIYWSYARRREIGYLKSQIIGIDIDGVLNKHREHFCNLLREKSGKDVKPEAIIHIPVHESELGVSKDQEDSVFNDPKYWIEMPLEDNTPYNLKKLSNIFKFKIHIFTHRPWPIVEKAEKENREKVTEDWNLALVRFEKKVYKELLSSSTNKIRTWILELTYLCYWVLNRIRKQRTIINRITKLWLKKSGFKYQKLIIEKGNDDSADPRGHIYNRFQMSIKENIRFFVEDDWEKAIKLAFICDVVFLFDHPYNQKPDTPLPNNIIRVKSWNEIYRNIRRLS